MHIGEKLRELRESKDLSQGEIEKRSGVLRVYVSRVENGHTVPAIETLEKLARALEVPMYQLFYEGDEPPKVLAFPKIGWVATLGGAGRGGMRAICVSYAASSLVWMRQTADCSFSSRRRSPELHEIYFAEPCDIARASRPRPPFKPLTDHEIGICLEYHKPFRIRSRAEGSTQTATHW